MKSRFIALALFVAGALCATASAQTAFTAILDGAQEVPPTATTQTGVGSFTFDPFTKILKYSVTITGLTGGITGSHIHLGNFGVNGGIQFNIVGGPPTFSGTAGPLSAPQEAALKAGGLYVNVHSATFPGGEMRGQITPGRDQYIVVLGGAKEVPPTPSQATGSGTLTLNGANQVVYDINFTGLTGGFVASHIHDGAAGVNGGILFNLTLVGAGHLQGTTAALSASQRAKLRSGALYVNVHSGTFPGGEIRGQTAASFLPYGTGCPHPGGTATLTGDGITMPGGNITIGINNGVNSFGLLYVSVAAFSGTIGFGCPLFVHPAVLIPITLPLPPGGALALPATLPPTTAPGTVINLQYIGDKGGGVPYDTNGLQMIVSN